METKYKELGNVHHYQLCKNCTYPVHHSVGTFPYCSQNCANKPITKNTMKTTIITAALTTIAVNLLFSSALFWVAVIAAIWIWMGNIVGKALGGRDLAVYLFAPVLFVIGLIAEPYDLLPSLQKIQFQSPIKRKEEESPSVE